MRKPGHPRYPTPFAMSAAHRMIRTTPGQLPMDHGADRGDLAVGQGRHLSCFRYLPQERNSTAGRSRAVPRSRRATAWRGRARCGSSRRRLLEIEDPKQADGQHGARGLPKTISTSCSFRADPSVKLAPDQNEFEPQAATRVKAARWWRKAKKGSSVRSQCSPGQRSAQPLRT